MFIVVDLIIVLIILVCTLLGFKRGLTECMIKICSFILAIVVSVLLFKPISLLVINNTKYDENIQTTIVQMFEKEEEKQEENVDEETENLEGESSSPVYNYIVKEVKNATEEKKREIVSKVARDIAVNIINVITFIILFVVLRFALIFVKILSNFVTRLPVIKQCDKIGGILYGLFQAFVIIFIGLALITFISTIVGQNAVLDLINQSVLGSILSSNNLLIQLIF